MKNQRHKKICELIEKNNVETQSALAQLLCENGFIVTQTTVSRDIKELKLIKILSEDGQTYKYALPNSSNNKHVFANKLIFGKSIISVTHACNIVIIKTVPSAAPLIANALDSLKWNDILGTIGGFDTVFVALPTEAFAKKAAADLKDYISSSNAEK